MAIFVDWALLPEGWQPHVRLTLDAEGRIESVAAHSEAQPDDRRYPDRLLLAAPANLHSHAFQRAMAGHAEHRGAGKDTFWTWREAMYGFVNRLTPEDVEAIAAFAYMEMLETGFSAVGEFHYLHHQIGGAAYENLAEMAQRIVSAAENAGIGLTHLPVLYSRGGVDDRPLSARQARFGNDIAAYLDLRSRIALTQPDSVMGAAAHSLRAVSQPALETLTEETAGLPLHIHIAEQLPEIEEVVAGLGKRPVRWLLDTLPVDERWCLIHATHMTPDETVDLAKSGAVAGLCPITEANLGDGIFDGVRFAEAGGRLGVGSDSHIRIDLSEELRLYEYSQRLRDTARAVARPDPGSVGDWLLAQAQVGGAQALGRQAGQIMKGHWADLLFLDADTILPFVPGPAHWIDHWIFVAGQNAVRDVWSAGRECVRDGRHLRRDAIAKRLRQTMADLLEDL